MFVTLTINVPVPLNETNATAWVESLLTEIAVRTGERLCVQLGQGIITRPDGEPVAGARGITTTPAAAAFLTVYRDAAVAAFDHALVTRPAA